ncbi:NAD(P) transhydrogenase subunit beta [Actinoplanes octamycinicus]|uniref:NAD(P) transhydrogenase subunit beta n=1 Tax=Actinoplanes octamycinicus TaxID=135948 RepID=A0A7W7H2E9_9ACTN|nr:NAD(P)(+) transhydrogenase (Re/Si-specific) subunit beta [Actinoplanes octamycinicus]MBB4742745.1 NAD(P) transhydrogenase subunit beta [Actinoplanes octamycinicus]GIE63045.1 NAD(P) transhydrogenase subunit beta [Actinoplanes octamycinicus]
MTAFDTTVHLVYLACATLFVAGLHLMNAPATARRGNRLSAAGMLVAIVVTIAVLVEDGGLTAGAVLVLTIGALAGGVAGLVAAQRVRMTAMPQLVSLFNAVGGGAAALIALGDRATGAQAAVTGALDVVIGALTFSGSLIAAGKLAGRVPGRPIVVPGGRILSVLLAVAAAGLAVLGGTGRGTLALAGVAGCALALGVLLTLPIGGADMPVVISLLNACTGTAVAMAGFVLGSTPLIIAGALVGAAGAILTKLMADAMNRSIPAIIAGGYGSGDQVTVAPVPGTAGVRAISAEDAGIQLGYAGKVVIVPGYGLAAAQAQHEVVALAQALTEHGVDVSYAIHPVAGRMPGHMNVLLAEANAPYQQLKDLDESNPAFPGTDVALVVGANDVTNPAARRPGNAVSGMPILDVDKARSVIVIKRSLGHGYAGIDNELYQDPKTAMLFADAKVALTSLLAAVQAYAG